MQRLKHCAPSDVYTALRELPSGLFETYERILAEFDTPTAAVHKARHVFECIALAKRKLSTVEVLEILSVDLEPSASCLVDLDLLIHVEDAGALIRQMCPSLLEVVLHDDDDDSDGDGDGDNEAEGRQEESAAAPGETNTPKPSSP